MCYKDIDLEIGFSVQVTLIAVTTGGKHQGDSTVEFTFDASQMTADDMCEKFQAFLRAMEYSDSLSVHCLKDR